MSNDLRELLEEWDRVLTANPLEGYNNPLPQFKKPHSKQLEFHSSRDPIKMFIGGNRSGKTSAGVVDDLIQALPDEFVPEHLKQYKRWEPPFYCRIVTPDLGLTMQAVEESMRKWVPQGALKGGSWENAFSIQKRKLDFDNGSFIEFMSQVQDVNQFGGTARHRIHWDEEPKDDKGKAIRTECQFRLIDFGGDELFTMTPLLGLSWTHDEIYERRHEDGITVVQVDIDDNPHLDPQSRDRIVNNPDLTDEERQARKSGKFIHFGGLFYDEFEDDRHVREPIKKDHLKDQAIVVGIDPGLRRTGVTWTAFDNDNAGLVFDEFYPSELTVAQVAKEIKARNKSWGIKPLYVIDPSARNRATVNADAVEAAFAREKIYCQYGQNDRAAGIMEVKRRLQNGTLTISSTCRSLIWEFGRYRRDPNANDEFQAVKTDDHLLDSLRYAVMTRAWNSPMPAKKRPPSYTPNHQPPYSQERFANPAPPTGAFF